MEIEDFAYIVKTNKAFEESVVSVLKSVEKKGWTIFQVYDLKERLEVKGFIQDRLKIIEICSGKHANTLLNINKIFSVCMPCRINIFEDNQIIKIASVKPSILSDFSNEAKKALEEVENEIKEIIEEAK
ncbi:MAG: DUF302 domain-containing protein [Nanoarchaeota archaeon]